VRPALVHALRLGATRWPRLAFLLARPLAWLLEPLNPGISEERVAAVFPQLAPGRVKTLRRRSWANFLRAEALASAAVQLAQGRHTRSELVPNPALDELRPPLILVSFHMGLLSAVGTVLRRLPGDVLVVVQRPGGLAPRPGVTLVPMGEDEWERARTFHRAITSLRSGAFVFTTLDGFGEGGYEAATVDAPMLEGMITLSRGAFALARITRTPIVPLVARKCGRKVEIACGEPIPPTQGDEAMAGAAAYWLGEYLREFPGEISLRTLEIFRPLPPAR
jgi:hypothetical protein